MIESSFPLRESRGPGADFLASLEATLVSETLASSEEEADGVFPQHSSRASGSGGVSSAPFGLDLAREVRLLRPQRGARFDEVDFMKQKNRNANGFIFYF